MELYQLRTFVAVAEEGHLTRAAERLFTSQPAVSAHIKALEEELGVALFVRTPKGMRLTDAGRVLRDKALAALEAADGVLRQARELKETVDGPVRLGLNTDPITLRARGFSLRMTEKYPGVQTHFLLTSSDTVAQGLVKGDFDGGYLYGASTRSEVVNVAVRTTQLVVVGPARWKDQLANASWQDVARLPWIWTPDSCPFNVCGHKMFTERGLAPNTVGLADDENIIRNLVIDGGNLSMLSIEQARAGEAAGELAIWPNPEGRVPMPISFIHLRERRQERLIQAMLDVIRDVWELDPATEGVA